MAATIEIRPRASQSAMRPIFDLYRDGGFIIGSHTQAGIEQHRADLDANAWRFLHLYGLCNCPVEWIEMVRENSWTFSQGNAFFQVLDDKRIFFCGNVDEYSAAFRFLILDRELYQQLREFAPDVEVQDWTLTKKGPA